MVSGHGEHRGAERAEEARRVLVLLAPAAIREIAGRDDERRLDPAHERGERRLDLWSLVCTRVKIGYMEEACRHDRMRL